MKKECFCCGYVTEVKHYSQRVRGNDVEADLCKVCAESGLDKSVFYPQQCGDLKLYMALGYVANMILHEITHENPAPLNRG